MEANPGVPELVEYIRQQIALHGPVTFRWFMQQALYHPEYGYYGSGRARIGRRGDYYTSVSVGKIFGELLAKQFEEMWVRMNCPVSFSIVEEGAHDGQFAHDVLEWIRQFAPDLYAILKYWIVEPNPRLQQEQQARLSVWPRNKIRWNKTLDSFEDGSLCGVFFANELLDAFPVHMVASGGGPWQENFVDASRSGFKFVYGPPSNTQLRTHLERLPVPRSEANAPISYRTEVNLTALRWIEDISKVLGQGYVLLADYGYSRDQYYAPEHADGTLRTYHLHHRASNPLEMVGECDITAHVDFTSLAERAESSGLRLAGYCDQHHFLIALGENDLLEIERCLQELTPDVLQYIRSFKTLIHPSTLGMAFKMIAFEKSLVPGTSPLTGFSRCSDGRAVLGLQELLPALGGSVAEDPYAAF
jgi:SAM-dependent MidA family methyltransferase